MITIGNIEAAKACVGSVEVAKAYVGAEQIYPSVLDLIPLIGNKFRPRVGITQNMWAASTASNAKRCCLYGSFSDLGIDISQYSKMEYYVKAGYDYNMGTGLQIGQPAGWQQWSGNEGNRPFEWVTTNQGAIITLDATTLCFASNLRYDNDTTQFPVGTVITDIVEIMRLIR